jgi:hypothetical protein
MSAAARVSLVAGIALALVGLVGAGCDGGREGDRCNPDLSHDDCNDGLTCVQPATCVENHCCPADPRTSSDPYCNGSACPAADAGATTPVAVPSADAGTAESASSQPD